jgi:hypothetical protein
MLRASIVGLLNVGRSTLFNAVTRTRKPEAANYPFCAIDPNVPVECLCNPLFFDKIELALEPLTDENELLVHDGRRNRGPVVVCIERRLRH